MNKLDKQETKTAKALKEKVNSLRNELSLAAVRAVRLQFPAKILSTHELFMNAPAFQKQDFAEIKAAVIAGRGKTAATPADGGDAKEDVADMDRGARKRKRVDGDAGAGARAGTTVAAVNEATAQLSRAETVSSELIPTNQAIVQMMDLVKKEVIELIELCSTVKIWIQLNVPRIEDGNNSGVAIQGQTLDELSRAEDNSFSVLESMTKYFVTRGKIASKVLKYPSLEDYQITMDELDEKEWMHLRLMASDLRDSYAVLYDMIDKNWEKIVKPRTQGLMSTMY